MNHRKLPLSVFTLLAILFTQVQADRLYIADSHYGNNIFVLENGLLVDSWERNSNSEYGIYVDNDVFTMHYNATGSGTRYLSDGTDTGQSYNGGGLGRIYDAATDGYAVFTADFFSNPGITVRNRDYSDPELLFSGKFLGVTYDPNSDSLWVNTSSRIENRNFSGELLSSFTATTWGGIAMDYSDSTLWVSQSQHDIAHYSLSGTLLGQYTIQESGHLYAGMEFDFAPYSQLGDQRSFMDRTGGVLSDSGSEFNPRLVSEPKLIALFLFASFLVLRRNKWK